MHVHCISFYSHRTRARAVATIIGYLYLDFISLTTGEIEVHRQKTESFAPINFHPPLSLVHSLYHVFIRARTRVHVSSPPRHIIPATRRCASPSPRSFIPFPFPPPPPPSVLRPSVVPRSTIPNSL